MKISKATLLAAIAFLISFFLPAYAGSAGWKCFHFCWDLLLDYSGKSQGEPLKWLYYSGFVFTNLLFVAILVLTFRTTRYLRTRFILSTVLFFHVLSWFFVNFTKESWENMNLQSGYFVWLLAFALLAAAQVLAGRSPALIRIPEAPRGDL